MIKYIKHKISITHENIIYIKSNWNSSFICVGFERIQR